LQPKLSAAEVVKRFARPFEGATKQPITISLPPGRNISIAHDHASTLAIRLSRAPIPVIISYLVVIVVGCLTPLEEHSACQ
jgi:hypothetical protein